MLSNNVNNSNDPINNSPNIFHNNNNKNNEISEHGKNFMNLNMKNPFEN